MVSNVFYDVWCTSATHCTAVGYSFDRISADVSVYETLVEVWDGSTWTIVNSPNPPDNGDTRAALGAVWCASTDRCIALGGFLGTTAFETFTMTWDGSSWTMLPSIGAVSLHDLWCMDVTTCVAVGSSNAGDGNVAGLWDGVGWSLSFPPDVSGSNNVLRRVSCTSPSDCIAVGTATVDNTNNAALLMESWNGAEWTIVAAPDPTPDPAHPDSDLRGISCTTTSDCVAVGSVFDGTSWRSLIEMSVDPDPPASTTTTDAPSATTTTDPSSPATPVFTG